VTGGEDQGIVLIAYDGSADARAAVVRAGALLRPAPTIVLHIADSLESIATAPAPGEAPRFPEAARHPAETIAHARATVTEGAQVAGEAGLPAETRVVENPGAPWSAICRFAEAVDAAVIVCGTRGRSGLAATMLGSTAHGVLHHARRPVLIVSAE
jgi:nucleotide-binding universal stress UspA family protein